MQRFLRVVTLTIVLLALGMGCVFFGAVHVEWATYLHFSALGLAVFSALWCVCDHELKWGEGIDLLVFCGMGMVTLGYFLSGNEFQSRQEWLNVLTAGAFYMGVRLMLRRTWQLQVFTGFFVTLAAFLAVYAIWQHYAHSGHVLWKVQHENYAGRVSATYVCPNHFAGLMAMAMPLVLAILIWGDRIPSYRLFLVYTLLAMAGGIFFSFSRGGWLAASVGMATAIFLGSYRKRSAVVFLFLLFVGGGVAVALLLHRYHPDQWQRFLDGGQHGEVSRLMIWPAAWAMFKDHWLFGVGPMMFDAWHAHYRGALLSRAMYVHNDYLQVLTDYGVVGGLLVGGIVVCVTRSLLRGARGFDCWLNVPIHLLNRSVGKSAFQRAFFAGGVGSLVAMGVHVGVDFDFHIPANSLVFVTLLGLLVSMAAGKRKHSRNRSISLMTRHGAATLLLVGVLLATPCIQRNRTGEAKRSQALEAEHVLEWDVAEKAYEAALIADPRNSRTWEDYTQFLYKRVLLNVMQRSRFQERFAQVSDGALRLNPLNPIIHVRKGEVLDLMGEFELAGKYYDEALAFDPGNPYYHNRLGLHFQKQGKVEQAAAEFQKALDLNGGDLVSEQNLRELRPM